MKIYVLIVLFIIFYSTKILSNEKITLPNTFSACDQASAEKFNENFNEIQNKFNRHTDNHYNYQALFQQFRSSQTNLV